MPHYITWADFCSPRQPLKFPLLPPNEGVTHCGQLKHGNRDYDAEQLAYSKAMLAYRMGDLDTPPKDWRQLVGDKWAGIYICENPEVPPCHDNGYQRPLLWDGCILYECLIESCPRLIQATHNAAEGQGGMGVMRKLQGQLASVFRNEFKVMSEQAGKDTSQWAKATRYFEYSVELVARWMLMHYEMYPLWWGPMVTRYAEVSPQWVEYVVQATKQAAIKEGRTRAFTPRKK